jgi:transcriptional regulator with XRE-family HTH domain
MSMPSGKQPESGPFARAISAEIRAVMGRHRVSQALLAQRVGVSKNYLGKRLRDEVPFTANDIEAICDAMREDLLDLLQAAFHRMQQGKEK